MDHQISDMEANDILQNINEGSQQLGFPNRQTMDPSELSRMNRQRHARLPDPPASRRTGKCKFFNCTTGFGFIYDRGSCDGTEPAIDVDIFFHWTDIAASEPSRPDGGMPFRSLAVNETVEFRIERGKAGYCAKDITGPRRSRVRGFGLMANRLVYPKPQGQVNGTGNRSDGYSINSNSGSDLQQFQFQQGFTNGLNGMNGLSGMSNGMNGMGMNGMNGMRPMGMNDFPISMGTRNNTNPGFSNMQQPLTTSGTSTPNNFYPTSPSFGTFNTMNTMGFPQTGGMGTGGFVPNFSGGMVAPFNNYNTPGFDYSSVTGSPNPQYQTTPNFDGSGSPDDMGMGMMGDGSDFYGRGRGSVNSNMRSYGQGM